MSPMEAMSGSPLDLLPELVLVAGSVATLLLGMWTPQHRQGRARGVAVLAAVGAASTAIPALLGADRTVYGGTWAVDDLTGVVRLLVPLTTAVVILLAGSSLRAHPRESEAYALMLLGATGAVVLAGASDLLMLVAAYLLASVPLYALAGFAKDARGVEATLKYYLMGAFAGVLMLVGVSALLLATGSTSYEALGAALPGADRRLVAVGAIGLLAGVGLKAGAVPMHFWVPDVTAGTTPAMAAFITTVPKLGAVTAAFRLLRDPLAGALTDTALVVAVIAAASMTLGNLAAFQQSEVLRLLGYSTISQVGYLLMVVAVAARTDIAGAALAVYLAGYAVTNVGAFAAAAAFPTARRLREWGQSARHSPWLVGALVVLLLGLVGTPPTAVFVGKLAVFSAAADGGLGWLVVIAAANTVASLFYYLRWVAPAVRSNASVSVLEGTSTRAPDPQVAGAPGPATGPAAHGGWAAAGAAPARIAVLSAAVSLLLGVGAGLWLTLLR